MKIIKQEKFHKKISKILNYEFEIFEEGLHIIEISARARSEKQIGPVETDDDDLRIEINDRKSPKLNNPRRYFDSPTAFSGGKLRNLKKTIFFLIYFSKGKHILTFVPDRKPKLEEFFIRFVGNKLSTIDLELNNQAEDGDRRPWITFSLVDLPIKQIQATIKTERRFLDSDDIKLIIDGEVKRNIRNFFRRFWFWAGSFFQGETQEDTFQLDLGMGLHYIEFIADRTPTMYKIGFDFGTATKRIPNVYDPEWTGDFDDDSEQVILARIIFGEARGVSRKARTAAAWSIRNRVEDERWGDTYHEVILKPKQYSALKDDNYEFVIDPLYENKKADRLSWFECYEIAGRVINGEVEDPTDGANHYYSDYIDTPSWTNSKQAQFKIKIDNLIFYYLGPFSGSGGSEGNIKSFLIIVLGAIGVFVALLGILVFADWHNENARKLRVEELNKIVDTSQYEELSDFDRFKIRDTPYIEIFDVPVYELKQNEYGKLSYIDSDGKEFDVDYNGQGIRHLKFSPSGKKLGFYASSKRSSTEDISLIIMDIQGRIFEEVYSGSFKTSGWEWFSDEEVLVSVGCGTECQVLDIINVESGEKHSLQYGVGYEWSPDKKYVVAYHYSWKYGVTIGDKRGNELFSLRRDSPEVYSPFVDKTQAVWSHDSKKLSVVLKKEDVEEMETIVFDVN